MKKKILFFVLLVLTAIQAFAYRYMEDNFIVKNCKTYIKICYPDIQYKTQASIDLDKQIELQSLFCSADELERRTTIFYCKDGDYQVGYFALREKSPMGVLSSTYVIKRDRHGNWGDSIFSEQYSDYQGINTYNSLCNKYANML